MSEELRYEIEIPNCQVKVKQDMAYRWWMSVRGKAFVELSYLSMTVNQLQSASWLFYGGDYPTELREHVRSQLFAAKRYSPYT